MIDRILKDRRYVVATKLNREELDALTRLANAERLPIAQIMRRLIWIEAQRLPNSQQTPHEVSHA